MLWKRENERERDEFFHRNLVFQFNIDTRLIIRRTWYTSCNTTSMNRHKTMLELKFFARNFFSFFLEGQRRNIDDFTNLIWMFFFLHQRIELLNQKIGRNFILPNALVVVVVFVVIIVAFPTLYFLGKYFKDFVILIATAWGGGLKKGKQQTTHYYVVAMAIHGNMCDIPFHFRFETWLNFRQCYSGRNNSVSHTSQESYKRQSFSNGKCILMTVDFVINISIVDYWLK